MIDRVPKPCLHKQARHVHGHRNAYILDRCRCLPCCYAASLYEQDRARRNAYGRSNYIDAAPAREHVAALMAAGVGLKRIVKMSGVPQGVLWKLVYGKPKPDGTRAPSKRVTRATAERLLGLDPANPTLLADGAVTDPTGTRRRLEALACLGWSIGRLADHAGMDRQRLDAAMHGRPVVAATVRAVAALYGQLWDQQAPATDQRERISVSRTVNRAKAAGWVPPLAWDDIDDPAATPAAGEQGDGVDEVALDAALSGVRIRLTGPDIEAAVERMTARGMSAELIAERLRTYPRAVQRIRSRQAKAS